MFLNQYGGYPPGFSLKKPKSTTRARFERTFTQVLDDDTTSGKYVGYDYTKNDGSLQGTAWLSSVKKAYRKNCKDFRQAVVELSLMRDLGLQEGDPSFNFNREWSKLTPDQKLEYKKVAAETQCEPMVILMREITPGNNKHDFTFRQRKYYVVSHRAPEPKRVNPSTGRLPRIYRFIPKVYPMRLNETLEQFKRRKNL